MNANEQLLDATIERSLLLNRYSAGTGRRVVSLLQQAQSDILDRLPSITGIVSRRRLEQQLSQLNELIGEAYSDIEMLSLDELRELAEIESQWQIKTINNVATFDIMRSMPTKAMLEEIVSNGLVIGNVTETWWRQQSRKMQDEFSRVVRLGMSQSETNQQITKRVKDAIGLQQRNAFALVKTATQAVAIKARETALSLNPEVVKGKISIATLDSHTTLLCAAYDQAEYYLDNTPIPPNKKPYIEIPRHFGCRSMWGVILKDWKEMGLPFGEFSPSTRASLDGQIPAKKTFEDFLSGKSKEWQDSYLGKGKAELFRQGKISLGDMVDGIGRELTLDQLRKF